LVEYAHIFPFVLRGGCCSILYMLNWLMQNDQMVSQTSATLHIILHNMLYNVFVHAKFTMFTKILDIVPESIHLLFNLSAKGQKNDPTEPPRLLKSVSTEVYVHYLCVFIGYGIEILLHHERRSSMFQYRNLWPLGIESHRLTRFDIN